MADRFRSQAALAPDVLVFEAVKQTRLSERGRCADSSDHEMAAIEAIPRWIVRHGAEPFILRCAAVRSHNARLSNLCGAGLLNRLDIGPTGVGTRRYVRALSEHEVGKSTW